MLTEEVGGVHDNLHDERRQRGARARAVPGMAEAGRAGRTIAAMRGRFQDSRQLLLLLRAEPNLAVIRHKINLNDVWCLISPSRLKAQSQSVQQDKAQSQSSGRTAPRRLGCTTHHKWGRQSETQNLDAQH